MLPTVEAADRVALSCRHTVTLSRRLSGLRVGSLDADTLTLYEASLLTKRHDLDAATRVLCNLFEISRHEEFIDDRDL